MQIDHCLILAAGQGTRMGEIGKVLPKVLWPVFEKTLLELQVAYARSLGIKNIYINLHYRGEQIEAYCKSNSSFDDVVFLWERPEVLDIGGAIHNLASLSEVDYKGKLLVLNADQFFYTSREVLEKYLDGHKNAPCILFSYWVNPQLGYNALDVDGNKYLRGIIKNKDLKKDKKIETYTGISVIDLAQLMPVAGKSSFFESVCTYQEKKIPTVLLEKVDYWDFGTLKRYWETSFKILETYVHHANHPFLRFLVGQKALKTWKINLQQISYNADGVGVINLMPDSIAQEYGPSIILGPQKSRPGPGKRIYFGDMSEEIIEGPIL